MSVAAASAKPRLPVSLLTGFLGSGKTTILNRLVRDPSMRKALIIINEFGSVGIDHDLVAASKDDEVVVEMSSGCLCCTIRGDLVKTLRDAPWRFARGGVRWFDRVLIETTGLADPIPILHTVMADEKGASLYEMDSVITAVDAATGMATLDTQAESVRQAAVADRLLLTKTDLVSPDEAASIEARLRVLNPAAPISRVLNGQVDPTGLFGAGLYDPATKGADVQTWLNAEAYDEAARHHHDHANGEGHDHDHDHSDINRHDEHIHSICLTFDAPLSPEALECWLDVLMMFAGEQMLRIKGILNLAGFDQPMVIHGVQHIFHPPVMLDAWPSGDRRSRIVFITRDIDEVTLRETIASLTAGISRFEVYGPEGFGLIASGEPNALSIDAPTAVALDRQG